MSSRFLKALAFAVVGMGAVTTCRTEPKADASSALRVCADPNNMPFSNAREQGFENRIARLIADTVGQRLEYEWWAQRRGFVRNTLNAGTCDLIVGVPAGFKLALTTQPYYRSTYVFVTRHGDPQPRDLTDARLRTLRIGVHLIGDDFANTPPGDALARRGIVTNVRGYSLYGDYSQPDPPAALVRAVASRAVDLAIVWGPLAGYFARLSTVPLTLTPIPADVTTPSVPFAFDIAMGVRNGNTALRQTLDTFITRHRRELHQLLDQYHIPRLPLSAEAEASAPRDGSDVRGAPRRAEAAAAATRRREARR